MCGMSTENSSIIECMYIQKKPDDDNKRVKWELNEWVVCGAIENGLLGVVACR